MKIEDIHSIYTYISGKADALAETGLEADFPVMFTNAILDFSKSKLKELSDEEINKIYLEKYDGHMGFLSPDEVREFAKTIIKASRGEE